jgi:hypothetical protein
MQSILRQSLRCLETWAESLLLIDQQILDTNAQSSKMIVCNAIDPEAVFEMSWNLSRELALDRSANLGHKCAKSKACTSKTNARSLLLIGHQLLSRKFTDNHMPHKNKQSWCAHKAPPFHRLEVLLTLMIHRQTYMRSLRTDMCALKWLVDIDLQSPWYLRKKGAKHKAWAKHVDKMKKRSQSTLQENQNKTGSHWKQRNHTVTSEFRRANRLPATGPQLNIANDNNSAALTWRSEDDMNTKQMLRRL